MLLSLQVVSPFLTGPWVSFCLLLPQWTFFGRNTYSGSFLRNAVWEVRALETLHVWKGKKKTFFIASYSKSMAQYRILGWEQFPLGSWEHCFIIFLHSIILFRRQMPVWPWPTEGPVFLSLAAAIFQPPSLIACLILYLSFAGDFFFHVHFSNSLNKNRRYKHVFSNRVLLKGLCHSWSLTFLLVCRIRWWWCGDNLHKKPERLLK